MIITNTIHTKLKNETSYREIEQDTEINKNNERRDIERNYATGKEWCLYHNIKKWINQILSIRQNSHDN